MLHRLQEIIRAKERYEKAQLRKLRALAQLEASSFALTTRSRTRKVVNYNEVRIKIKRMDRDAYAQLRSHSSTTTLRKRYQSTRLGVWEGHLQARRSRRVARELRNGTFKRLILTPTIKTSRRRSRRRHRDMSRDQDVSNHRRNPLWADQTMMATTKAPRRL